MRDSLIQTYKENNGFAESQRFARSLPFCGNSHRFTLHFRKPRFDIEPPKAGTGALTNNQNM